MKSKSQNQTDVVSTIGPKLKEVDEGVRALIQAKHPEYTPDTVIGFSDLLDYRLEYTKEAFEKERKPGSSVSKKAMEKVVDDDYIAGQITKGKKEKPNIGQRVADALTRVAGSWSFIIGFILVLGLWIGLNSAQLLFAPFDPFPFILLNLVLSCLAAIQAPVIIM